MNTASGPGQPATGRLARALQAVLITEVLLLGPGLGLLWLTGALSGCGWALLAIGGYVGLRALAVSNNFLRTHLARSPRRPEHRLGPWQKLRLFFGDLYATLIVYSVLFPFEARLVPLAPKRAGGGAGLPIVLVPGFCCNRGYWAHFVRWFRQAGLGPVYAVSLEPLLGSLEQNASALERFVEAVCAESGADRVILVGHSMGGLVSRQYLHGGGQARIERILCLGSPHRGTVMAKDLRPLGQNLRQMCPDSAWVKQFGEYEKSPCPVPITAIVTPQDNIVAPQDSCELRYPNARNVFVPGIGHLEMVISRPVFEATVAALRATG